jgi:adenylate cyclase
MLWAPMRRALTGLLLGLAGGAVAAGWAWLPDAGHDQVEALTYDWRLARHPRPRNPDIVFVEINESSVRALAPFVGRWPWPRMIHAGAISYLSRAGARLIVYDVQFSEPDTQGLYRIGDNTVTGPESDAQLVAAVRRAGNVVLLADALFEGLAVESTSLEACGKPEPPGTVYEPGGASADRPNICLPFGELRSVAAAVGHNYLEKDPGGVSRALHPFVTSQGVAVPSLGLAALLAAEQTPADAVKVESERLRIGADKVIPLRPNGQALLWLRGPFASDKVEEPYARFPFFDVLLSEERVVSQQPPVIPESEFAGKIVFVGTSATGLGDVHATAFGGSTPGMMFQATLTDNVQTGEFIHKTPRVAAGLLTAGAGVLAGLTAILLPVWWAVAAIAAVGAGWMALASSLVGSGVWMPVVAPLAALVLATTGGLAWQYFVEGRARREVRRLFSRYVSRDIVRRLESDPSAARLGGDRREMTVLFSDIRGFTSASEAGRPEAIVEQLNEYFTAMVDVLFRHQGTLDKFVGDMVMGLFGAPLDDARHADHAVAAALEMSERLDRLNARWASEGRPQFNIGIGINTGEMIAGNIGSESIMSYTVIGDAVNLGSRIESLNKDYGTRILISEATRARLAEPVATRRVDQVKVKGRQEPVVVYEVTDSPPTVNEAL